MPFQFTIFLFSLLLFLSSSLYKTRASKHALTDTNLFQTEIHWEPPHFQAFQICHLLQLDVFKFAPLSGEVTAN